MNIGNSSCVCVCVCGGVGVGVCVGGGGEWQPPSFSQTWWRIRAAAVWRNEKCQLRGIQARGLARMTQCWES